MMIYEDVEGARVVLTPEGRLDVQTAPELELKLQEIKAQRDTYQFFTKELALDFSKLTYISSLGLRVVLQAQKMMNERQGKFTIQNIVPAVREVFEATGLIDLFVKDERLIVIQQSKTRVKTVLSVIGSLDAGTAPILEAHFRRLGKENLFNIWLDLTELRSISNEACQFLLDAKQRMQARNGRLFLQYTIASESVRHTLSTHNL
jgi:anti-sigma B factor antagonist